MVNQFYPSKLQLMVYGRHNIERFGELICINVKSDFVNSDIFIKWLINMSQVDEFKPLRFQNRAY